MSDSICTEPGCSKAVDRQGVCFRHRVAGVGVTFRGGGGYGREAFHSGTNAEFLRENDGPTTIPSPRR